ncbi:MAG: HD-GYP domain-containing protein [bacterium]
MKTKSAKVALLIAGCCIIAYTSAQSGDPSRSIAVITLLSGLLAWLGVGLPWGGRLYPSDAILFFLLCSRPFSVSILFSIGFAVVQGIRVDDWKDGLRSLARTISAAAVCSSFLFCVSSSSGIVVQGKSGSLRIPFSSASDAISTPRQTSVILLTALIFFVVGGGVDSLLRSKRGFRFGEYWLLNFGANAHHHLFVVFLGAIMVVCYPYLDLSSLVLLAIPVVLTRDVLKRSLDLRASRIEAIKALSSSVDARDRYTYDHSNRVARLAGLLSREMGFAEWMVEVIEGGALLHDIGKLSIDAELLAKPSPLDEEEWKLIRQHPVRSAQVVSQVELLKHSAEIVKHHHERPDGKGYPDGLKGHQIPIGARILNVADAFDAMISDRPYRPGKPPEIAIDELRKGAGSEFDPVVVEYLIKLARNGQLERFDA